MVCPALPYTAEGKEENMNEKEGKKR